MSVSNEVEVQGRCLRVRMTGLMGPEWVGQSEQVFRSHVEHCGRLALRGVLYDVRAVEVKLGIMDLFRAGESLAAAGRSGVRFAVLARPEQTMPDRFFESVASNRGATVRVCIQESEAHRWLGCGLS